MLPQSCIDKYIYCLYNIAVSYEWDEAKNRANIAKGRPSFAAIEDFEWDTALIQPDPRHGEMRYTAIGYIGQRLHYVVFTERGSRTRIISLRKASPKEMRDYAET